MKIVVTGGSGRLGRYLLPELAAQGHEVKSCDLVPAEGPYHWLRVDMLNLGDLEWAFAGAEVVVHLAAIPHPINDPPERVFGVNVQGTYNVLEAALRAGVRRVVVASSECALGLGYQEREIELHYLPLDEKHPRYPQDPYGLSKAFAEDLCAAFTRRSGLETICLRPTWIWFPEPRDESGYRKVLGNPQLGQKNLWSYVVAQDMATAFRLAAEIPQLPPHAVCYVSAADTNAREETLALIDRFWPKVPQVDRARLAGHNSVVDCSLAEQLLGFRPQRSWRDWLS